MHQLPRPITVKNILRMIAVAIISLLYIFGFSSCMYTKQGAIKKFCKADTVYVFKTDTIRKHTRDTLFIPGETVTIHDSIKVDCVNGLPVFKPMRRTETKGRTTSILQIDATGKIQVDCLADSLMQVIDSMTTVINNQKETTVTVHTTMNWREKIVFCRNYLIVAFILGLALGLFLIIRK
jgi:uncharacterized membrane protein